MKKLLLVFAHPEDETTVSGIIAKYKKIGWQTDILLATDSGHNRGTLASLTPGTLEDPIYRAMERWLPNIVITFDKTGINNDPDHIKICYASTFAFQKYAAWLEGLQKKFRIRSSHDQQWFKRLEAMIAVNEEPKLYYTCIPESSLARVVSKSQIPKDSFGRPWRGTPDDQITTIIDQEYFILRMEGTKEHFMGKNDPIRDRL